MWSFKAALLFPLTLLFTSLAAVQAAAVPATSLVLTPDDFKQTISEGFWFIEHYSPWCGHCRHFEPTWMKLVEEFDKPDAALHLAQVNCAVHGDLCTENGVNGYPQMNLYHNGEYVETFKADRDFDILVKYLNDHTEPTATSSEESVPSSTVAEVDIPTPTQPVEPLHVQTTRAVVNPSGTITVLRPDIFQDFIDQGPAFIKFYAPWCGHCKKLAPTWEKLARHSQHKLNIAEVNCEDHKSLCVNQDVTGFPMLLYYTHGAKTEYTGGRSYEHLKTFTEKVASPTMEETTVTDLEKHVQDHSVLYLLLHTNTVVVSEVAKESHILLGSPPIFTSTSQVLFDRYNVPASSTWALIALKDHDSKIPTSMYYPSTNQQTNLSSWLLDNRLPTTTELSQDAFQQVMKAPHKPLVVIAAVYENNVNDISEKIIDIGKKWKLGKPRAGQRDVVFTWMNGDQWGKWMKSMYGMKAGSEPGVIIADHSRLIYYDQEPSGEYIKLTSISIFAAIDGISQGSVRAKSSENMVERFTRNLNDGAEALVDWIGSHPYKTGLFIISALVGLFMLLKRVLSEDLDQMREDHRKSSRLD